MTHLPLEERFVPVKRVAPDGKAWWCVYDKERNQFSTYTCHPKCKSKKECQATFSFWNGRYGEAYFK